jgi:hypothetical protein
VIPRLVRRQNLCGMCERMLFVLVIVSVLVMPSYCVLVCLFGTRREQFSVWGRCFLLFMVLERKGLRCDVWAKERWRDDSQGLSEAGCWAMRLFFSPAVN